MSEESATIRWDVPPQHIERVTVRAEDIDGFGHTNNVVYLAWCERVAWAHSQQLGMGLARYAELGVGCVAHRHELDYLAPTFAGDELLLGTWIAENDQKLSMWRAHQIVRVSDGRTVLRGRTRWVCVDMKSGRPRRQPPEFLAVYQPVASEPDQA